MHTLTRGPDLPSDPTTFGTTRGATGHTGSTLSSEGQSALRYWIDAFGSSGLQFPVSPHETPAEPAIDRIADFKTRSCLTWPQVARLFGVSKRAVMLWQAGGQMSASHEERLIELLSRLHQAPSDEPIETRTWLMTVDGHGTAPYQRWVEEAAPRKRDPWIDRQPNPR